MKKQKGFTMIEVLVSVLVLLFGVLGMAGLQMQAVNSTEQGRYNTRAAMQASSIVAAMKANPAYWGAPPNAVSVQNTTVTGGPAVSAVDCTTTACTAAQMAYFDLITWGADIATSLPVGRYAISCDNTVSPAVCSITISWQEKNVAARNPASAASGQFATGTVQTFSYQTVVSVL